MAVADMDGKPQRLTKQQRHERIVAELRISPTIRALAREVAWLPELQLRRYVRTCGTRARILLNGAGSLDDLGICFGADLYQRAVEFLIDTKWAMSTDDILWRRTKLGLRLAKSDVEQLSIHLNAKEGIFEGRARHE